MTHQSGRVSVLTHVTSNSVATENSRQAFRSLPQLLAMSGFWGLKTMLSKGPRGAKKSTFQLSDEIMTQYPNFYLVGWQPGFERFMSTPFGTRCSTLCRYTQAARPLEHAPLPQDLQRQLHSSKSLHEVKMVTHGINLCTVKLQQTKRNSIKNTVFSFDKFFYSHT